MSKLALLLTTLLAPTAVASESSWSDIATFPGDDEAELTSLAFDHLSGQVQHLAFLEATTELVKVYRVNAGQWEGVGAPIDNPGGSSSSGDYVNQDAGLQLLINPQTAQMYLFFVSLIIGILSWLYIWLI